MPTLDELAEDTGAYLLPRPFHETIRRDGLVLVAGPAGGWVHRIRDPDVEWVRTEARRRGLSSVGWWVGWSSPAGTVAALLAHGLVPDEPPALTAMTCEAEPPEAPDIEVLPVETAGQYLEAVQVDWTVWELDAEERARRHRFEVERFERVHASGVVHHFAARLDGAVAGFGRAIDMAQGVALMGGAVLPHARRRGVYRALVRARWDHAAARGTPLLVVQAGPMSAPRLEAFGFARRGEVRLLLDRL